MFKVKRLKEKQEFEYQKKQEGWLKFRNSEN